MYILNKNRSSSKDSHLFRKPVSLFSTDDTTIDLSRSKLSYDGNNYIFLNDYNNKTIYVLSVNGQYYCQLLSPEDIDDRHPMASMVETKHQQIFVELKPMFVQVFKLTYNEMGKLTCG